MHERSNGLGGGFAGYGIYPQYKDFFALHIFYDNNQIKAKTEEYGKYIKMGRECNKELLKELGMTDTQNPPKVEKKIKRVVRPVLQYDLDGEFIKEWESAYEAAEEVSGLRGAVGNIYNACTGRYKTAYGFIWKYKV